MQNEDLDYNFGQSDLVSPTIKSRDQDIANISVLKEAAKEIDHLIEHHNSKDSLDPSEKDFSLQVQILADKKLVGYLRSLKMAIDNKLKELK